jgi:Bacterial nucleoid DNA-binding protein
MKKSELVEKVLSKVEGASADIVSKVINATFESIGEALEAGDSYNHDKFGTFKTVERAARKGRNPQTGEEIIIEAKKAPKLVPSSHLKNRVNN